MWCLSGNVPPRRCPCNKIYIRRKHSSSLHSMNRAASSLTVSTSSVISFHYGNKVIANLSHAILLNSILVWTMIECLWQEHVVNAGTCQFQRNKYRSSSTHCRNQNLLLITDQGEDLPQYFHCQMPRWLSSVAALRKVSFQEQKKRKLLQLCGSIWLVSIGHWSLNGRRLSLASTVVRTNRWKDKFSIIRIILPSFLCSPLTWCLLPHLF